MKLRLACAAVFCCVLFSADDSLPAQNSGVLIGLRAGQDGLQTHWIVLGPGAEPHVVLPELIFPAGAEFWRLGERDWCDVEDLNDDGDYPRVGAAHNRTTERWIVPARTAPRIALGMRCEEVEAREEEIRREAENEFKKQNVQYQLSVFNGAECGWTGKEVAYVTPRLISETEKEISDCGMHPDADFEWHSVSLPKLEPLDLGAWYKGDLTQLFRSEFRKQFKKDHWDQDPAEQSEVVGIDDYRPIPGRWLIYHAAGRFRIRGFVKTHRTSGYYTDFDLPVTPPVALVGNIDSSTVWPAIKATVPNALDVYKSPRGDFAVVRTGTAFSLGDAYSSYWLDQSIIILELRRGQPGRELLRIPLASGSIVMVEWAAGANVPRWDKPLREWATHGLPEPNVVSRGRPPDRQ